MVEPASFDPDPLGKCQVPMPRGQAISLLYHGRCGGGMSVAASKVSRESRNFLSGAGRCGDNRREALAGRSSARPAGRADSAHDLTALFPRVSQPWMGGRIVLGEVEEKLGDAHAGGYSQSQRQNPAHSRPHITAAPAVAIPGGNCLLTRPSAGERRLWRHQLAGTTGQQPKTEGPQCLPHSPLT